MDKVRVGIIGCGGMGRTHARILATFLDLDVHLRVLCDVKEEAAKALQKEVGAERVAMDAESVFEDPAVDVVIIATHHHLHRPMCVGAAQAGKHIFCEKPLALTYDDLHAINEAVAAAGVKLMVGFQARFSPFVRKLKQVIPKPLVTIAQLIDPRWGDSSWANDPIEGGGNVLSQGCHCFDLVCHFHGCKPVTIYAEGGNLLHPALSIADSVVCTLRFEDGSIASVTIGDFGAPALMGKAAYQLFAGDKTGTLYGYYGEPRLCFWGVEPKEFTVDDLPEDQRDSLSAHGYVAQMRALIDWVSKDADPVVAAKMKDGIMATTLGLKAIEAAETGRVQDV